jgi:dTDP-4-amino-4,6-dideoxygalactose transaminase
MSATTRIPGSVEGERIRSSFLVFGQPEIRQEEMDEVLDSMRACWLGTGPKVARFEREFAAYKGVPAAAALNSCTAALHLALLALRLSPGDEVVTTPLTFCATVNTILHAGGRPVLADIDPRTLNLDPEAAARAVTSRTRAILPVHFAGRPCDMDALGDLAARRGLALVEDCAHAIETEWRGRKAGTIGDFGCFSFYSTKNVVTGEGGMALARRPEDLDAIRVMGLHGMSRDAWKRFSDAGFKHYDVVAAGFKYNMMDLQAAIGIHQLARVEENWRRREAVWNRYQEELRGLPLGLPADPDPDTRHAYHLYTVLVGEGDDEDRAGISRDAFLDAMTARKIGVGVHYRAIPDHPYYRDELGFRPEDFPHATRIGRRTVSLPLSAKLTDEDVEDVVRAVRGALSA